MLSVRARVVELTGSAEAFQAPVPEYAEPGRAKVDADAWIAITMDPVIDDAVNDPGREEAFLKNINSGALAQAQDEHAVYWFSQRFRAKYWKPATNKEAFAETHAGQQARVACGAYMRHCFELSTSPIAETTADGRVPRGFPGYCDPLILLGAGYNTFDGEAGRLLLTARRELDDTQQATVYLPPSIRALQQLASLSIAQYEANDSQRCPVADLTKGYINTATDIVCARQRAEHDHPLDAILRPRTMCPFLPDLPQNEFLRGGSGIQKLSSKWAELALNSGVVVSQAEPVHS